MPKEVLRSAAPAAASTPAAAAPAPAAAILPKLEVHLAEMEGRLRKMNLGEDLIIAALAAEKAKLSKGVVAGAAVTPASAAAPVAEKASVTVVEKPAEVVKPKTPPSDEEFARALAAEEAGGEHAETAVASARSEPAAETPGAADDDHEEDPTAGVVVQNHWSRASEGAITGPIDRSDFKTPQVKIVQGSGPLSRLFNQGTLIFMDTVVFGPPDPDKPGPPINFIPVTIQKYFRENLQRDSVTGQGPKDAQGNNLQPRNAITAEDVKRLGGTTEFGIDSAGNRVKPTWAPAARCLVIIERPEGCTHPAFTLEIEIEGKARAFAAAVFFVNGGQYRAFVKPIMDATNFILCEGTGDARRIILEKRLWKMQVVKEQSGQNMVFNPKLTMLPEATPPDLKEYAKSLRG